MTIGILVMLLGIFVVPAMLVWAGHRLRRRSPRWHAAFWGAVTGHLLALVIAPVAATSPAEQWSEANVVRGLVGLWSFLILPLVGAVLGALRARRPARE